MVHLYHSYTVCFPRERLEMAPVYQISFIDKHEKIFLKQDLSKPRDYHALLEDEISQRYLLLAWRNIVKCNMAGENGYLEASMSFNLYSRCVRKLWFCNFYCGSNIYIWKVKSVLLWKQLLCYKFHVTCLNSRSFQHNLKFLVVWSAYTLFVSFDIQANVEIRKTKLPTSSES